jgi:ferritin-like metal-binding protein YciE
MELQTLQELFLSELRELYSAEKQIMVALPKMGESCIIPASAQCF